MAGSHAEDFEQGNNRKEYCDGGSGFYCKREKIGRSYYRVYQEIFELVGTGSQEGQIRRIFRKLLKNL